jgi:hypothetical protein
MFKYLLRDHALPAMCLSLAANSRSQIGKVCFVSVLLHVP